MMAKKKLDLSLVLDALSDPTRRLILLRLRESEYRCSEFADLGPKTRLSYHFAFLEKAGLVTIRKEGVGKYLSLAQENAEENFPGLLQAVLHATRP
jgi:DNA-binding transcriptional ArsR family regulator